jgi:very-short-patch-repair endonuclease
MSELQSRVYAGLGAELAAQVDFLFNSGPLAPCESPIERAMATSIVMLARLRWDHVVFIPKGEAIRPHSPIMGCSTLQVAPQFSIGKYRVDLLIGYAGAGGLSEGYIAVECDGHDFHDRTKQQAQRDKSRDRDISASVAKVIRFTGSEIYRDPWKCADEAIGLALLLEQQSHERRLS